MASAFSRVLLFQTCSRSWLVPGPRRSCRRRPWGAWWAAVSLCGSRSRRRAGRRRRSGRTWAPAASESAAPARRPDTESSVATPPLHLLLLLLLLLRRRWRSPTTAKWRRSARTASAAAEVAPPTSLLGFFRFGLVVNGNGKQMSLNWCLSIYDFAFTEFYWVCGPKLAFTEFCRVLPSFYWIHWTFTSFFYLSFPSSFLFFSDGFLFWMKIKMASFDRFRWDAIQISTVFSLSPTTSSESRCSAFVHFIGVFSRFCVSSFFLSFSFLFVFFFCFYSPSVGRDDRRWWTVRVFFFSSGHKKKPTRRLERRHKNRPDNNNKKKRKSRRENERRWLSRDATFGPTVVLDRPKHGHRLVTGRLINHSGLRWTRSERRRWFFGQSGPSSRNRGQRLCQWRTNDGCRKRNVESGAKIMLENDLLFTNQQSGAKNYVGKRSPLHQSTAVSN